MRILFALFFTFCLLPSAMAAPDCPAQEVRLDKPGGPLEKSPTQDQDGLATCYANSASLMLQSWMPGNPNLSALDIAAHTGRKDATKNPDGNTAKYTRTWTDPITKEVYERKKLILEYDNVCDAVRAATAEGVCPREHSAIESNVSSDGKHYMDDFNKQAAVLKQVGTYLEDYKRINTQDPEMAKKLRESAPDLLAIYRKNLADSKTGALYGKHNLEDAIMETIDATYTDAAKRTAAKKSVLKYFELSYPYVLNSNELYPDVAASIRTNMAEYPELQLALDKGSEQFSSAFDKDIQTVRVTSPMNAFWRDIDKYFVTSPNWSTCTCDQRDYGLSVGVSLNVFSEVNAELEFENFLAQLADPSLDMFIGSIAPKCLDPANRKAVEPADVKCYGVDFPGTNKPVIDPKTKAISNWDKMRDEARGYLFYALLNTEKPMPATLTVCSSILTNAKTSSVFNTSEKCRATDGESHAVTMIGARKNAAGACEYLIQNSWGGDCTQYEARYGAPEDPGYKKVDCENGKIWIDEKELMRNMSGYSVLYNDKTIEGTPK